jgi:hypothetical protein
MLQQPDISNGTHNKEMDKLHSNGSSEIVRVHWNLLLSSLTLLMKDGALLDKRMYASSVADSHSTSIPDDGSRDGL